jgi:L-methionine (R)-S-oxide reductase
MAAREKQRKYDTVISLLEIAWRKTDDPVARMATIAALLFRHFDEFVWSGFYLLRDNDLTVGPYLGAPAAVILPRNRGVCWSAVNKNETVMVFNVHEFEGHLRMEGRSNSEISVPIRGKSGQATGVFHVDHADFDAFDHIDIESLERIVSMLSA